MTDLAQRVTILAALADPIRLQIVDALTLGDLSSSEVEALLAIRSNLLAHHLRVLERAGIVVRSRSELDKRRTYIGLRPAVFDLLSPGGVAIPTRVLFVCTANSARSRLAEAIWRGHSDLPALSAGTRPGASVNPGAVEVAGRHGLTIDRDQRPVHVDEVRDEGDLVITVCDSAHEQMQGADDLHWSIPDPVQQGSADAFDRAFAMISQRVQALSLRFRTTG